jgi:hypothetical protein
VRDDQNRVAPLEPEHQLFDGARAVHIERRTRLVHQDYFGFEREQPRDAELLLLFELQRRGVDLQAALQIFPQTDLG